MTKNNKWRIVHKDRFNNEVEVAEEGYTKSEAFAALLRLFNGKRADKGLAPFANWGLAVTCTRHARPLRAYPLLFDGTRLFEDEWNGTWRAEPCC